ncbi:MAG: threonylcarbamoyl-AMP synthase [Chitinophagaceae bacterium]|nr:threonylcarbamoyl-AMP synthase [Chitinophagaceae bacterium]
MINEKPFEIDVQNCVKTMLQDGVILYPTDTIWGLGCTADNEKAIEKIYQIKKRDKVKSFVILMTDVKQLLKYLANPVLGLEEIIQQFSEPTTIIYENAILLPDILMGENNSIAVRITKDSFCRSLIKRIKKPIVSTSANFSGEPSATCFQNIHSDILSAADYVVHWIQNETKARLASSIVKLNHDGSIQKIR